MTATISIAAILLLVLPRYSTRPYTIPRDTLAVLLFPVVLYFNGWPHIDPLIAEMAAGMVAMWIISTVFSRNTVISVKHTLRFTAIMFIGLSAPPEAMPVIVGCGVISVIVMILQRWFKTGPYIHGLAGNSNMMGAFLVPVFFLSPYFVSGNEYLFAGIVIILSLGLCITQCRAAQTAWLVSISLLIHWIMIPFAVIIAALVMPWPALNHRIEILKRCREQLTWKTALTGLGVYNSRVVLTIYQDRIDQHRPRRAHNDIIQMILDAGVVNAALYIGIMALSIFRAYSTGNVYMAAALFAVLINGLAFHTQSITIVSLVTWALIGQVN